MNITEVRHQSWAGFLNIFYICLNCDHVASQGLLLGYQCKICGHSGVRMFYSVVISSLIDSIQDFYFISNKRKTKEDTAAITIQTNPQTVIPLLFCTLADVILEDFLRTLMRKQGLSQPVADRLLSDHLTGKRRRECLFPVLTGCKWKAALETLSSPPEPNFNSTFDFYLEVNKARNQFLHDGVPWAIKTTHPQGCINHIWPLLKLFVSLHNKFVCVLHPSGNL